MQDSQTAKLTIGEQTYEFPIETASTGERAINIAKLRSQTGYVTMDDGLANTATCTSAITYIDGE